jgi:hypothetical protein
LALHSLVVSAFADPTGITTTAASAAAANKT